MAEPHADERRNEAPRHPGEQPPDISHPSERAEPSAVPEQRTTPAGDSGERPKSDDVATNTRQAPEPPEPPASGTMPAEQERDWALAAHLGSFLAAYVALGFLCPLVVLLAKGKASAYVRHHAIESLNFQLTALGAGIVVGVLSFVYVGLILLPFVVIGYIVLVIMGGIAAYRGDLYRYPVSIRLIS
jgi:uncharacterized Tic20 family protein